MAAHVPARPQRDHVILAGGLAGACEAICTFPLEYVKTQLQLMNSHTSSLAVVRDTMRRHGLSGLYRGLPAFLIFSFPRAATRFYIYEGAVRAPIGDALNPSMRVLLAGAAAGVVEAATCVIPMTTLQVRMGADSARNGGQRWRGVRDAVTCILREEGPRGLYLGAGPTLLKISFNVAGRFLLYERFSQLIGARWDANVARLLNSASVWGDVAGSVRATGVSLLAGGLAGAVTVVANHPVDAIKTRLQSGAKYSSAMACAYSVWKDGGIRALYRGLMPRLNRVIAETALTFAFYERISDMLTRMNL